MLLLLLLLRSGWLLIFKRIDWLSCIWYVNKFLMQFTGVSSWTISSLLHSKMCSFNSNSLQDSHWGLTNRFGRYYQYYFFLANNSLIFGHFNNFSRYNVPWWMQNQIFFFFFWFLILGFLESNGSFTVYCTTFFFFFPMSSFVNVWHVKWKRSG